MKKRVKKKNKELIETLFEIFNKNEKLYDSKIDIAFSNFENFATMPYFTKYGVKDIKNKRIINMIYSGIFPYFIRTIIEKEEGHRYSKDKQSFIIKQVKKVFKQEKINHCM